MPIIDNKMTLVKLFEYEHWNMRISSTLPYQLERITVSAIQISEQFEQIKFNFDEESIFFDRFIEYLNWNFWIFFLSWNVPEWMIVPAVSHWWMYS